MYTVDTVELTTNLYLSLTVSTDKRALHRHCIGRGFESCSEPEFFSGLCCISATAILALMIVITQLLLMDKINFTLQIMFKEFQNNITVKTYDMVAGAHIWDFSRGVVSLATTQTKCCNFRMDLLHLSRLLISTFNCYK